MNLESKSAKQLDNLLKRNLWCGRLRAAQLVATELATRIEHGPVRSTFTKKRQRMAGLLPKVQ